MIAVAAKIKLKEPLWLLRRSHSYIINLGHVGEPFVAPPSKTELYMYMPCDSLTVLAPMAPAAPPKSSLYLSIMTL